MALLLCSAWLACAHAADIHVSPQGDDRNPGGPDRPLHSIQAAADRAVPGDVVTVHAGVYREWVRPARGGTDDGRRIIYQAAPGEIVEIRGSEPASGWKRMDGNLWTATVADSLFGSFHPYREIIGGNWFDPKGRMHHCGGVIIDGEWIREAPSKEDLLKSPSSGPAAWFAEVKDGSTTFWCRFPDRNPVRYDVEIMARPAVFFPERTGIDFITVRGFRLRNAATPWAPPTAKQYGIIGPHWSKGWIIEDNIISNAACTGISLGKSGPEKDPWPASVEGYTDAVREAAAQGWSAGAVGHHVVRRNTIFRCEQAGIVGSLGAAFSLIEDNHLRGIHAWRQFAGFEQAAIKLHGAVGVTLRGNRIHDCNQGIWLDWMAQGARLSHNLVARTGRDVFLEVDHGPILLDHNLLLSGYSLDSWSTAVACVHNHFGGKVTVRADARRTPYFKPGTTILAGDAPLALRDDRWFNNVFAGATQFEAYTPQSAIAAGGNVYFGEARPLPAEDHPDLRKTAAPVLEIRNDDAGFPIASPGDADAWASLPRVEPVTAPRLGKAPITGQAFLENGARDFASDLLGRERSATAPMAGAFEGGPGKAIHWALPAR